MPVTSENDTNRIYWNLILLGDVAGQHLSRRWLIPVEKGTARCSRPLPEGHAVADQRRRALQTLKTAVKQIRIEPHSNGVRLISLAGRSLSMNIGLMIFGAIFTGGATSPVLLSIDSSSRSIFDYIAQIIRKRDAP